MNTTTQTTLTDLVTEVRKIAEEYPDRQYVRNPSAREASSTVPNCMYAPNNLNPDGCIMGLAMRRLGIEYDPTWDEGGGISIVKIVQELNLPAGPNRVTQMGWLSTVQGGQDAGLTWEHAVENADETARI